MSIMIYNLKSTCNNLTDEQRVTTITQSLLELTWGQMKLFLTHSENIKIFADISHHLKLEEEHIAMHNYKMKNGISTRM